MKMTTTNSTQAVERKITMNALREIIHVSKEKLLRFREEELRLSLCDSSKGIECVHISSSYWDEDYMNTLDWYSSIDFEIKIYIEFVCKGSLRLYSVVRYSNFDENGSHKGWIDRRLSEKPINEDSKVDYTERYLNPNAETQAAIDACDFILEGAEYGFN